MLSRREVLTTGAAAGLVTALATRLGPLDHLRVLECRRRVEEVLLTFPESYYLQCWILRVI